MFTADANNFVRYAKVDSGRAIPEVAGEFLPRVVLFRGFALMFRLPSAKFVECRDVTPIYLPFQAFSTSLDNVTFSACANWASLSSEMFSRPRSISER